MQTRIEKIDNSKQDTIEDTGWIEAELITDNGISATTSGNGGGTCGVKYRKIGNHVYVCGSVSIEDFEGDSIQIAKLPYSPSYSVSGWMMAVSSSFTKMIIDSAGTLSIQAWISSKGGSSTGAITWSSIRLDYWIDLD